MVKRVVLTMFLLSALGVAQDQSNATPWDTSSQPQADAQAQQQSDSGYTPFYQPSQAEPPAPDVMSTTPDSAPQPYDPNVAPSPSTVYYPEDNPQ